MLKQTHLQLFKQLREATIQKNRLSVLFRTICPKSPLLWIILLFYWMAFAVFTGLQIYHRQFVLYLFLSCLGALLQIYTVIFIWNYFSGKWGLRILGKALLLQGAVEKVVGHQRLTIAVSNGEVVQTPFFPSPYQCQPGEICHVLIHQDKTNTILGVIVPSASIHFSFSKNMSVQNFVISLYQHFAQTELQEGIVIPIHTRKKLLTSPQ
ncbi:MAG: hypothetical protein Q7T03_05595 [Deltaproteobacteria bacterium]|nr:hypothetical protein [Deltaproteobacteria bacterium]